MLLTMSTRFKALQLKVELYEEDCSRLQIMKTARKNMYQLIKHSLDKKAK